MEEMEINIFKLYCVISDCLTQEHVNNIDFDYKEYAKQRFQEYWLRKHLLSSDGSSYDNVTGSKVLY